MTREEAHRILSNGLVNAPSEHEWCMAFYMAIQALSQEPCDDCKYKTFTELYFHTDPEMVEQQPCEEVEYEVEYKCHTCKHGLGKSCDSPILCDDNNSGYEPCEDVMREFTEEEAKAYSKALDKMYKPTGFNVFNEPCDDAISKEDMPCVSAEEMQKCKEIVKKYTPKQEMCEDAISREAVLQELTFIGGEIEPDELTCIFRDRVKQLPPVTPKPETVTEFADRCRECGKMRKGHWIKKKSGYECSECACDSRRKSDFCQYCGAKMVEPQESENEE